MSAIERVSSRMGRRDEQPNIDLARELAGANDDDGIREIVDHLGDRDQAVPGDCIKVLYEVGEISPALIAPYAVEFVHLLDDKENRMVWGAMSALATIAVVAADDLIPHIDQIQSAIARGSVITGDAGVRVIAGIASTTQDRNELLFPWLLAHLQNCRAKEVPQHAESSLIALNAVNRTGFIAVLESRFPEMMPSQSTRVRRVIKSANNLPS